MRIGSLRGLAGALSLVATITAIMLLGGHWQWEVFLLAAILALPLYVAARGDATGMHCFARRSYDSRPAAMRLSLRR